LEKIIMPRAKSPSKKAAAGNGDARSHAITEVKKQSALQTSSAAESRASNGAAPKARATETSVYPSVSEEQIRQRAYELYTQRGGGDGRHVEDWFRAEAELLGRR
jgi:hypothetical protein